MSEEFDLENLLPENFEGREQLLAKFKSVDGLAASYVNLEKMNGQQVRSAEEYNFPLGVDEKSLSHLRARAMQAGLTQQQFEQLAQAENQEVAKKSEYRAQEEQELRSSYGEKLPEAQAYVALAMKNLDDQEIDPSDPKMFRVLEKMGRKLAPKSEPQPEETSAPVGPNPMEVGAQCREVMMSEAYNDKRHNDHMAAIGAVDKMTAELLRQGFSGAMDPKLIGQYDPLSRRTRLTNIQNSSYI